MPNCIVYQAATPDTINECRYSLLKYLSIYNLNPPLNIAINIYTNAPSAFEAFSPFFERFEIMDYEDSKPRKIDIIKDYLSKKTCNLIYLDTDCYPAAPVDHLFQELLKQDFLFLEKGTIDRSNLQKIKSYLSGNNIQVDDVKISYPSNDNFFSTEFFGINYHSDSTFQKIFQLYLQLLTEVPPTAAEEFAFHYYAGSHSTTIQDSINSYRNFPAFKKLLAAFFLKNQEESIPNLVKLVYHLDAKTIFEEKNRYDRQPFVKKILSALSGKAWSARQYQNKF